jgi:hypothetical protein
MGFTTLNLGLTLQIPTNGTRNWGTTLRTTTWTRISQHKHTGAGDGAQMVTASYTDRSITSAKLAKNIAAFQAPTLTPVGTTQTLDFDLGQVQKLDLGSAAGDVTVTLTNPQTAGFYTVLIVQGATPRDVVWPASVKWANGQKLLLSQNVGEIDKVSLYYDGTNFFGDWDITYA